MTVPNTTRVTSYAGDNATKAFAYPFRIFLDADLQVTLRDANGVDTVQTITTHYTVQNAGMPNGGTVTMVTAPAAGETLIIERVLSFTQLVNLRTEGSFKPETHEKALDYLTMLCQQLQESADVLTIAEYTSTSRPAASSVYENVIIVVRDDNSTAQAQICLQDKTNGNYTWSGFAMGGIL